MPNRFLPDPVELLDGDPARAEAGPAERAYYADLYGPDLLWAGGVPHLLGADEHPCGGFRCSAPPADNTREAA
jgi:hypothetical protein